MSGIYLCILIFLLCLAIFDLFVGVSNDAVNFLQPAVGARVVKFRTILIVASCGVILGAIMSSGMMDVARHGIMMPDHFSFNEVMIIFLSVMVTDVMVLDVFNSLGLPTSTTVSIVFDLLGGTFALATIKIAHNSALSYSVLLNSSKALNVIIAIFVSVAIAFFFGVIVMWISRIFFTFSYKKHLKYIIAIFGGIAFTTLAYFIFLKGLGTSPYISDTARNYINVNTNRLLVYTFIASTIIMEILYLLHINIFKFIVLMGTFALAMAFAGNDLVNFIGVPLAGLSSFQDYIANAHGAAPSDFMMNSLMASAKTPPAYLLIAGIIMIIAIGTSKKAQKVIKTSVDLSRQDEGDEMFGSSKAARALVRFTQNTGNAITTIMPDKLVTWINSRFNKNEVILTDDKAAFDLVRASINLVLSAMLITIGTNHKLPLSTTYITFMVAMGSSLADRAWSRESAVFRVTGVLSVIGGWFITAGVAFITCGIVCLIMYFGGFPVQLLFMALVIFLLIRSNRRYAKKEKKQDEEDDSFRLMMRLRDPELVWDLLKKHVSHTQSYENQFALKEYNQILNGLAYEDVRSLRHANRELKNEQNNQKKYRRQEMLGLKKSPLDIAVERNTWFHLGANANQQFLYSLRRMLDPIKEHVDNSFSPLPAGYVKEFQPMQQRINNLMKSTEAEISTGSYDNYREILAEADDCKDELSILRKKHLNRMQEGDNSQMQINLLYLNVLQESQEFLSVMRHQLRAAKKFMEN
ncbi:MAG: inorganic phosphate transporter [Prevotella sp.]|jgi:phosphate/sulfate permease|nr:inorganic phosphate transporter [Prevotella sp.]MCH3991297.1 inorganic phosphate transporter [Prevotella sp.]MCH4018471.1 inorganic phosphate transporter [Prevotella sp.]MCH4100432.1 inorganic phosphate transporter [Prevotella sp.]MCH4186027.1 inorganic phosphate transporter [Prevotella sp.]